MYKSIGYVFVLAVMCSPASAAKLYKWVDADGNTTYSQQKPPGQQAEQLELRVGGPGDEAARSELDDLTGRATEATADREFAATATAEIKARDERLAKNCEIARENRRVLQNAPRVQATDENGEPYFIDDASRQQRLEVAEQQITDFCQ